MSADRRELPEPKSLAELAEEASGGGGLGIVCPRCKCVQISEGGSVRNTIRIPGGIRRYRPCRNCGYSIRTTER
jgi:hypothetical protein